MQNNELLALMIQCYSMRLPLTSQKETNKQSIQNRLILSTIRIKGKTIDPKQIDPIYNKNKKKNKPINPKQIDPIYNKNKKKKEPIDPKQIDQKLPAKPIERKEKVLDALASRSKPDKTHLE